MRLNRIICIVVFYLDFVQISEFALYCCKEVVSLHCFLRAGSVFMRLYTSRFGTLL